MDTVSNTAARVTPWNKGKLLGQKPPLKLKEIWAIQIRLQLDHRARELALFNLASTASCAGAISWGFASTMWSRAVMSPPARSLCRRRRNGRCNSRSPSKRGKRSRVGSRRRIGNRSSFSFRAACRSHLISRPGRIPGSSGPGRGRLGLIRRYMAPTRCVAPNRR